MSGFMSKINQMIGKISENGEAVNKQNAAPDLQSSPEQKVRDPAMPEPGIDEVQAPSPATQVSPDEASARPADTVPPTASSNSPDPPVTPTGLNSHLSRLNASLTTPLTATATGALNSQIVQAVQFSNNETTAYAASQIAVAPNMMITQAGGLVAQSAANYFDGASKLALASKSVLLKNMTEKFAKEDMKGAAEDALGVLITDLLVGTAAAVAAAAGAIEGEAANFALDRIDQSLQKYQTLLNNKGN